MASPPEILDLAYKTAIQNLETSFLANAAIAEKTEYICRNLQNRAAAHHERHVLRLSADDCAMQHA
jgi:hypothetical protein